MTAGSGPPLLFPWNVHISDIGSSWRYPAVRENLEKMCSHFTLCMFDWRNTGASTKNVPFSLEAWQLDLDAALGVFPAEPMNILLAETSGATFRYMADHPERFHRLATWGLGRTMDPGTMRAVAPLLRIDPEWVKLFLRKTGGGVTEQVHQQMIELFSGASSHAYWSEVSLLAAEVDVTSDVARLSLPTLVAHRRGIGEHSAADVASHIPGAQLYLAEGDSWWWQDVEDPLPVLLAFLAEGCQSGSGSRST